VRTFSVGFAEAGYDEAPWAAKVAAFLGTRHTELYVDPRQALDVIPRLPEIYDEPFADSSQIPTFLVCQLAREEVTVALSGDGGDGLFGGYTRYFLGRELWDKVSMLPRGFRRRLLPRLLNLLSPGVWEEIFRMFNGFVPRRYRQELMGDKIAKLSEIIDADTPDELYYKMISHWRHSDKVVIGKDGFPTIVEVKQGFPNLPDFTQRIQFFDLIFYLPDDILVKVDRASMAVSLEARVPLLDHRVVELAWKLPMSVKIRDGGGKWILKRLLSKYLPESLIERPKMGFAVPIDVWLRGPLREWAEDLLSEERLKRDGFFDPSLVRRKWEEHLSGRRKWHYHMWDVLMFQAWLDRWN